MNKLLVILCFLPTLAISQNSKPFAIWEDQSTGDYYFVQIVSSTGMKSNIAVIPGMTNFVAGSKTAFNTDSNYYHAIGLSGTTFRLYTIDAQSGGMIYNPAFPDNVVGLEYNCNDSLIYGLRVNGNNYDLVTVDYVNGTSASISASININGYVAESLSLDRKLGLYNFVALDGSGFRLLSYSIKTGALIYDNPFPDNLTGHNYSCRDSVVVALWEDSGAYHIEKINLSDGTHSRIGTLSGVTPGYVSESSDVSNSGIYVYRGFNGLNVTSIITVDISTGSTINVVPTSDNARGFREPLCCYESVTVGKENLAGNSRVLLFPNPTADYLHFNGIVDLREVNIYSTDNRLIRKDRNFSQQAIDVSGLWPGFYVIEFISGNRNREIRWFVKM